MEALTSGSGAVGSAESGFWGEVSRECGGERLLRRGCRWKLRVVTRGYEWLRVGTRGYALLCVSKRIFWFKLDRPSLYLRLFTCLHTE